MSRFSSSRTLLAGSALMFAAAFGGGATAQPGAYVPNFQPDPGGWTHPFGGEFPDVTGSAPPMHQDPKYPFITPQQSFRIGDLRNPNIKPWAKEVMAKDIDEIVNHGKIQFTANSSCLPMGVPMFALGVGPFYILQTPKMVVFMEEAGQQVRRVYLNVPHSPNAKTSWYGESVGHYEGDTLVIDTVGLNTKTVVEPYRTPHTEKLHVTERWRLIDGGNGLQVDITVDDPDTYYQPWSTYQRYQRGDRPLSEFICAENNTNLFDYHMPVALKPDF
jgi:hypothetical protein